MLSLSRLSDPTCPLTAGHTSHLTAGRRRLPPDVVGSARLLSVPLGSSRFRSAPLGSSRLFSAAEVAAGLFFSDKHGAVSVSLRGVSVLSHAADSNPARRLTDVPLVVPGDVSHGAAAVTGGVDDDDEAGQPERSDGRELGGDPERRVDD